MLFRVIAICLLFSSPLFADHDETLDGDLSNDPNAPTVIALNEGSNLVSACSISGDVEYFTVNVPVGKEITAIDLTAWSGGSNVSFLGVQNGTIFTELPATVNVANILGYVLLGLPLGDVLPLMATSAGAIGFTPPLPAGDYTFWAQETSTSQSCYSIDIQLTCLPAPVPALSTWGLYSLMLMLFSCAVAKLYSSSIASKSLVRI